MTEQSGTNSGSKTTIHNMKTCRTKHGSSLTNGGAVPKIKTSSEAMRNKRFLQGRKNGNLEFMSSQQPESMSKKWRSYFSHTKALEDSDGMYHSDSDSRMEQVVRAFLAYRNYISSM